MRETILASYIKRADNLSFSLSLYSHRAQNSKMTSNVSDVGISRISFTEQLDSLTKIKLPILDDQQDDEYTIDDVDVAVEQVLSYFNLGRDVLSGLDAQDDVEWMFEGRDAILNVGKTIMKAGELMDQLMTVLEQTKSTSGNDDASHQKKYIPVIEKIEHAICEWHKILELIQDMRNQVDIATEWKDLNDQILTDVEQEINQCYNLLFEIQENRHFPSINDNGKIDIDKLSSTLNEKSPFIDNLHPKLPTLSQIERTVNDKFIELSTRLKPLQASLDFIPLRLEQYSSKADKIFPTSIKSLNAKYITLKTNLDGLMSEIQSLQKELGEDRWSTIFRNTGNQAREMLESYQQNLEVIKCENDKLNPDYNKIERLKISNNSHLTPAIDRILTLLDRALKDHLKGDSEMYNLQAKLHKQWQEMLSTVVINNSPLASKQQRRKKSALRDSSSSTSSSELSTSTVSNSSNSPLSSMENSPTLCHQFQQHIKQQPQQHSSLLPIPSASPRPMHSNYNYNTPTPTPTKKNSQIPRMSNDHTRTISRLRKSSVSQCDARIPPPPPQTPTTSGCKNSRVVSDTVTKKSMQRPSIISRPSSQQQQLQGNSRKSSLPGFMQPRKADLVNQQQTNSPQPKSIKRPSTVTGTRTSYPRKSVAAPYKPAWR